MLTYNEIKSQKWRNELNKILLDPHAKDHERLFFVCFCYNTLNWDESTIIECIQTFHKWLDFDLKITTRQVNLICERIQEGKLGKIQTSYTSWKCSETKTEETHTEEKFFINVPESETTPSACNFMNRYYKDNIGSCVFQVSPNFVRTNVKEEIMPKFTKIQVLKDLATFDDGSRWYNVTLKKGNYGEFFSIDTGPIMPCQTEQGEIKGRAPADRYMSLPNDREALVKLIDGIKQALAMYPDGNKKKESQK